MNKMIFLKSKRKFNLNIANNLKTLLNKANKILPDRSWFLEVTYWDDGDYRIEATTNGNTNNTSNVFIFENNKFYHIKRKIKQPRIYEDNVKEI